MQIRTTTERTAIRPQVRDTTRKHTSVLPFDDSPRGVTLTLRDYHDPDDARGALYRPTRALDVYSCCFPATISLPGKGQVHGKLKGAAAHRPLLTS